MEVDLVTGAMRILLGNPDAPGNDLDNWLKKKDADQATDGTRRTYWYTWKGGPPPRGNRVRRSSSPATTKRWRAMVVLPRGKLQGILQ